MPSIEDRLLTESINLQPIHHPIPPVESILPTGKGMFVRCSVPPIGIPSVDDLQQSGYKAIPQYRIFVNAK